MGVIVLITPFYQHSVYSLLFTPEIEKCTQIKIKNSKTRKKRRIEMSEARKAETKNCHKSSKAEDKKRNQEESA